MDDDLSPGMDLVHHIMRIADRLREEREREERERAAMPRQAREPYPNVLTLIRQIEEGRFPSLSDMVVPGGSDSDDTPSSDSSDSDADSQPAQQGQPVGDMERAIAESLREQQQIADEERRMQEIIEQTKREEEETRRIREFVRNREYLQTVLATLKGVDPSDPIFEQFYE